MAWREPRMSSVRVGDGEIGVGCWGEGSTTVLASHGITANHRSFGQLAWALDRAGADVTLAAVDHRGRGTSSEHPGPYGLRQNASDLLAVLDHLDVEHAAVVGHSMGAYVATIAAELAPGRISSLVLVDGALSLPTGPPLETEADVERVVRAVIGPALDRLDTTFPTRGAYLDFWRAHPAFAGGGFNDVMEAHLDNDLRRTGNAWTSSVVKQAVLADGRDTLVDEHARTAIERISQPTTLLWAPRGMLGHAPGLFSEDLVTEVAGRLAHLEAVRVDDVNHYTVLFSEPGAERVARALVARL